MNDLLVDAQRQRQAVIQEWKQAQADGNEQLAARIIAANPDIFSDAILYALQ